MMLNINFLAKLESTITSYKKRILKSMQIRKALEKNEKN